MSAKNMVVGRGICDKRVMRRKNVLRRLTTNSWYTWYRQSNNPGCRLGHRRAVQESDVWLQGGTQHHLSHCKIDLWDHPCRIWWRSPAVSPYQWCLEAGGGQIFFQMEFPPHPGGHRWQACGNQVSQEWWLPLLQLPGLSFSHTSGSCGCQVQVSVGGCWHQWL